MNYFLFIILYGIKQINGDRSALGLYYILIGKKSSQSIQDARLYKLGKYFGVFSYLDQDQFLDGMNTLTELKLINRTEPQKYQITKQGKEQLYDLSDLYPSFTSLNGLKYSSVEKQYWKRLTLYYQSLSNLIHGEHSFYPVHRCHITQQWVKQHFPNTPIERSNVASQLKHELMILLENVDPMNANNFVYRLSRFERVGYTNQQLAFILELDEYECWLRFLDTLHYVIESINGNKQYSTLQQFLSNLTNDYSLTKSTSISYKLLKQGKSIEQISKIRKLKQGTIEDHIVEMAFEIPNFPIHKFISDNKMETIKNTINKVNTSRLKLIKEQLDEEISYFEIRLVMAHMEA